MGARTCARCDHANLKCTYCYAFCIPLMYDVGGGCDAFKPIGMCVKKEKTPKKK